MLPPDLQPAVDVVDVSGDVLFINQAAIDIIAEFRDLDTSSLDVYAHRPVTDNYTIHLDAGEAVEIFVGAPSTDMAFFVRAPGERLVDAFFSDGGGGLYGSDARDVFRPDEAGDYTVQVTARDFDVAGYVIRVDPAS